MWREEGDEGCRRCGAALEAAYCAACGQARARRLTVRRVLGDLASHVTSLDSALARTVLGMSRRPGELIRRYIEGDRTSTLNPAKYAFLGASLYALAILTLDARPAFLEAQDGRGLASMRLVVTALGYLLFFYFVPAAWLLSVLFRRWKVNFAEAYAGLLFYAGHLMLLLTVVVLVGAFGTQWGFWVARAGGLVMLLWVLWDWFRGPPLRTLVGGVAVWLVLSIGGIVAGMLFVIGARLLRGHW